MLSIMVGNRTGSHLSTSYNYQPFNKLTATQNTTYAYDANGNMTSRAGAAGDHTFEWDEENRLTGAQRGQYYWVYYGYDALGRRVKIETPLSRTNLTYDGLDVVMEETESGASTNGGVITKYQNGLGIDNKLKITTGGQAKYFLADHLGSTIGLTDGGGNITESASYDSFGNASNYLSTRYQYTGREYDEFTGLHYYRARWYDANLGRFISEDPIGFAGGDINLYGYVYNQPLLLTDPSGKFPIWDHYWFWYYSKKCAETGIKCANSVNNPNQSQQDLERMAQEAFNRGVGSVSGLRFKVGYADNYYCRQMEDYGKYVYGDSFPTNVQKADVGGSFTETAKNVGKAQPVSQVTRAWNWFKSFF